MNQFDYSLIPDPQTRLDRYLEKRNGENITASSISFLFSNDIPEAEYQLRRWVSRHPRDCFSIRASPLEIRITVNENHKYNRNVHEKNFTRRYQ
ncbi:hypothetical protein [Caldiplasma sukawensis]